MNLSSASTKKSPLGAAGRQSGSTKNPGAATGVTRDPSWEPKISKKPWENKDFQKIKKKTLFCFAQTDNVKIELWCRYNFNFVDFRDFKNETKSIFKTAKIELSCRRELIFQYFTKNQESEKCGFATAIFEGCSTRKRCF